MDKFGSLFASPFTPGDGEASTGVLSPEDAAKDSMYNPGFGGGQLVGGGYNKPIFGGDMGMPSPGPVVPPEYDMPSPAVLPPDFIDMPGPGMPPPQAGGNFLSPIVNNFAKQLPGQLAKFFGGGQPGFGMPPGGVDPGFNAPIPGFNPRPQPMPQPIGGIGQPGGQPPIQTMPFRQPNFRPDTRAPGGGGMDYNGNPVGGGMGVQFNFAGPGRGMQQPMPMQQPRRMAAPMKAPGPVRPATSIKRPRIR